MTMPAADRRSWNALHILATLSRSGHVTKKNPFIEYRATRAARERPRSFQGFFGAHMTASAIPAVFMKHAEQELADRC